MLKRLLTLGSLLLVNGCLYASLTITPSRQEIRMPAGSVFIGTSTVNSSYEVPAFVMTSCSEWFKSRENKDIKIEQWLKVYPSTFTLNPGESAIVNYEVSIPKSAKGELVGMISFKPDIGNMSGVSLVMSSALYVVVSGTDKYNWDISKVKIFKNAAGKLQADAFIKNKGNVHVRPIGVTKIIAKGKKEEVVAEIKFGEGRPAYPGDERQMVAYGDFSLKPGKYTAITKLWYGSMMREKKATITVTVNDKGESTIK